MPLRTYQTLAEARRELAERLGYGADPDAANAGQLTSYLRRAHQTLYERLEWSRLIVDFPLRTVAGVWRYDYPSATPTETEYHADPDRIRSARVERGAGDAVRLGEGFDLDELALRDQLRSWPQRYRRREQLEIWPTPDGAYTITLEAYALPPALDADTDRLVVPDDVVLADALYHALIDRGSPASPALLAQRDTRVREIRARAHGDRTYVPGGARVDATLPRPRVA